VHDARGRLVHRLVDAAVAAGPTTLRWNGQDDGGRAVASGRYLVRLALDGREVATTAVTVLR
jgi:flagellar hook assembly protein FlgD